MNGPSNRDKKGQSFDWMEFGIVFAGVLVVVGLFMESWPEIKLAIVERRFPNLTVTGGVIVTVGVLIEVILGIFITQRSNRAQSEANERVAKAELAAAEANRLAEQERHARLKIEEKLASRNLTDEGRKELIEALTPHAGTVLDIVLYDAHVHEVYRLYADLATSFSAAGWYPRGVWISGGFRMHGPGVVIGIARDTPPQERMVLGSLALEILAILVSRPI